MITIARYWLPMEAHIDRARLEAAGINAFVADEHTINMNWLHSNAMGGVRLMVPADRIEEAKEILAADHSDSLPPADQLGDAEEIPDDYDLDARRPTRNERRAGFLTWLLLGIPLFGFRRKPKGNTD